MHVFNPILSKNFIYSNLKLTTEGLYYKNKVESKYEAESDDVFITDGAEQICNLVGLDYDSVLSASLDEFFEMLLKSDKFRFSRFVKDKIKEKNTVELFNKLGDFIEENGEIINPKFNEVPFGAFSNINPKFLDSLSESTLWLSEWRTIGKKFNGGLIKNFYPDYVMQTLSETIPIFKDSFGSKKSFQLFIIRNDNDTIMRAFKERTEKVS